MAFLGSLQAKENSQLEKHPLTLSDQVPTVQSNVFLFHVIAYFFRFLF